MIVRTIETFDPRHLCLPSLHLDPMKNRNAQFDILLHRQYLLQQQVEIAPVRWADTPIRLLLELILSPF